MERIDVTRAGVAVSTAIWKCRPQEFRGWSKPRTSPLASSSLDSVGRHYLSIRKSSGLRPNSARTLSIGKPLPPRCAPVFVGHGLVICRRVGSCVGHGIEHRCEQADNGAKLSGRQPGGVEAQDGLEWLRHDAGEFVAAGRKLLDA